MVKVNSPSLAGKVSLVTGAARGLGLASAWAMAEAGAAVMITDMLADIGEASAAELRAAGHKAAFRAHDVRDAGAWASVVADTVNEFGGLDILVNNAGISHPCTIEDATEEGFRRMLDINLIGPFLGMQAAIPAMKVRGGGSIVNISSNSTRKVVALTTTYAASKAGLANLTKSASVHLAESGSGIRCNSVHPGPCETEMLMGEGGKSGAELPAVKAMIQTIPMRRMGRPAEVGALVAFLASDAASYLTGGEYFVDGGVSNV